MTTAALLEETSLTTTDGDGRLTFELPDALRAREPVEARAPGLERDDVRLMVSYASDCAVTHTRFTRVAEFLRGGDVLVVNTSATINAALIAQRPSGEPIELHFSQRLPDGTWAVELRRLVERGTAPVLDASAGETIRLPGNGSVRLLKPYGRRGQPGAPSRLTPSPGERIGGTRLWRGAVDVGGDLGRFLERQGFPIRYAHVPDAWPPSYYRTIFGRHPGSAEMPSASRPFTERTLHALARRGVMIAPILLHTGVSSLEDHEPPFPEYFRVSEESARLANEARRAGGRVIAVGTTAVRALETVASSDGTVSSGSGWTDLVIGPDRGLRVVNGLLTGFHEPRASHLAMLEALAGREHVASAYDAALRERYLWHEFGDVHLLLPGRRIEG